MTCLEIEAVNRATNSGIQRRKAVFPLILSMRPLYFHWGTPLPNISVMQILVADCISILTKRQHHQQSLSYANARASAWRSSSCLWYKLKLLSTPLWLFPIHSPHPHQYTLSTVIKFFVECTIRQCNLKIFSAFFTYRRWRPIPSA